MTLPQRIITGVVVSIAALLLMLTGNDDPTDNARVPTLEAQCP